MKVSLTPELEKLIEHQVKSGLYQNASEVVREAIRRAFYESASEPEWLQEKIAEGLASPSRPVTEITWKRIERRGAEKATRLSKRTT